MWKSASVTAPLLSTVPLVEAGRLDLGSAHAVADEQEDVLGFLEQAQQAVLLVGCGIRANVKSRKGM